MLVVCDLVVFVSRLIFCESYQGADYDQFMYTTSMAAVRLQHMYHCICRWSIMHTSKWGDGILAVISQLNSLDNNIGALIVSQ